MATAPEPVQSPLDGDVSLGVEVRESRRARRLRLTVSADGPPVLVVPVGTRSGEVRRMLRDNSAWMERKTAELRRRDARRPRLDLAQPGAICLHGAPVPAHWKPGARPVATLTPRGLAVGGDREAAREAIERWYRREARERIGAAVEREAPGLGVSPTRLSVRDQRTRWGSCSASGALSFSWRLLLAPPEVLDYVVVHELCHMRRLDHSPAFWALVAAARPGFEEHVRWLRAHGPELSAYDPSIALRRPPTVEPPIAPVAGERLFEVSPEPGEGSPPA